MTRTCPHCDRPLEVEEVCYDYDKQTGIPGSIFYVAVCEDCGLASGLHRTEYAAFEEFDTLPPKDEEVSTHA